MGRTENSRSCGDQAGHSKLADGGTDRNFTELLKPLMNDGRLSVGWLTLTYIPVYKGKDRGNGGRKNPTSVAPWCQKPKKGSYTTGWSIKWRPTSY